MLDGKKILKKQTSPKESEYIVHFSEKNAEYPYWIFGAFVFVFVIPFRR